MSGSISGTIVLTLAAAAATMAATPEPSPVRRFALVVGANRGAVGRVPLRYAVADAERFAQLVTQMGGVAPDDRLVLHDPTRTAFLDALTTTEARVDQARAETSRVEVIVYFSGHADDQGLMLGREVVPYRELRAAVSALRADVGITILDACASGAITRLKGGRAHPAFLAQTPGDVQGYAFLTSSSENEAAQESERLGGSFFTHALVSALRGAADVTGDGRVTLNEAYQFAFHETLAQTTTTEGGAQHPSYDIKMAGTGDVVMTDVRQTSSTLILGEDHAGRFYVLNSQRQLVAELYKAAGRRVELGLEPGTYDIFFEQEKQRRLSSIRLADGEKRELVSADLRATRLLPTRRRGTDSGDEPDDLLDGRLRAQAGWRGRFSLLHWNKPTLAYEVSFGSGRFAASETDVLLGVRYYPKVPGRYFRPYIGLLAGSFAVYDGYGIPAVFEPHQQFGAVLPVGVDIFLGRRFAIDLATRNHFVAGGRYRFDASVNVGVLFGGRSKKK